MNPPWVALCALATGTALAVLACWMPAGVALVCWFAAQIGIEFGWAGVAHSSRDGASLPVHLRRTRAWLYAWMYAWSMALPVLLLLVPVWWLGSGGGLPAFLLTSGVAAGSVFLLRRHYAYAAAVLFVRGQRRSLWGQHAELNERMWDQGDPAAQFWSIGFWFNLALLLKVLGAMTVLSDPFRMQAPLPQLGYALLLVTLGLWVVDRLMAAARREDHGALWLDAPESGAEPSLHDLADAFLVDTAELTLDLDAELVLAARRADEHAVAHLLQRGASADAEPDAQAEDRRSALVSAATCGRLPVLRLLIAAGGDVNRISHGLNPLLAATRGSYEGRPDVVAMLLANGAQTDVQDAGGAMPLHHAAGNRDPAVAQLLLDAGAPLEAADGELCTPLGRALLAANAPVAEVLLRAGARLDPEDAAAPMVLAAACTEDDPTGVHLLLRHKAQVDQPDVQGRTALSRAAEHDHLAIAEVLVQAGARLDAADEDGRTPLMWAARAGSRQVLQRMLEWRAQADRVDSQRRTALHHAALGGDADAEIVRLLLALGCPAGARDAEGHTALDLAMAAARFELAQALDPQASLPTGLDPLPEGATTDRSQLVLNALQQGRSALALELLALGPLPPDMLVEALLRAAQTLDGALLAALRKAGLPLDRREVDQHLLCRMCALRPLPEEAIRLLVAVGAADGPDLGGRTPLQRLCGAEHPPLAGDRHVILRLSRLLLDLRTPLNHRDPEGRSALVYALWYGSVELVGTLLEAGADPGVADAGGRTLLHHLVLAAREDGELLARALILAGCDPARPANDGSTPRGMALQLPALQRPEWIDLLDWPAGRHPQRRLAPADVVAAVQVGDAAAVEQYLRLGVPLDGQDARGASAALHAAGRGDLSLLQRIHGAGADLQAVAGNGLTPLGAATLASQHTVLRWLVAQGARVDAAQTHGLTALGLAAARGDASTVELLLELGAAAQPAHVPVESAPARVALRGLLSGAVPPAVGTPILARLLEAGADPNRADHEGRGLLLLVVGAGQAVPPLGDGPALLELMHVLHGNGAELNLPDRQGRTPLHWTCRHGLIQATTLLLDLGADPDLPDDLRKLPIDLAQAKHRSELYALLGRGARPH